MALSHGEIGRAFALNPLVTVGFFAILAWLGLWLAETWHGRPLLRRDWLTNRNVGLRITLGVILLVHWVYLCLTLPR
jgi:hypothetical protein